MIDWSKYPNFRRDEFDSPDEPGSGDRMNERTLRRLQRTRTRAGRAMVIVSGVRTPEHNHDVGGVTDSAHLTGEAADVAAFSSSLRFAIVHAATREGFHRIGIGRTFIHLDDDPTKPPGVMWLY